MTKLRLITPFDHLFYKICRFAWHAGTEKPWHIAQTSVSMVLATNIAIIANLFVDKSTAIPLIAGYWIIYILSVIFCGKEYYEKLSDKYDDEPDANRIWDGVKVTTYYIVSIALCIWSFTWHSR